MNAVLKTGYHFYDHFSPNSGANDSNDVCDRRYFKDDWITVKMYQDKL